MSASLFGSKNWSRCISAKLQELSILVDRRRRFHRGNHPHSPEQETPQVFAVRVFQSILLVGSNCL